jgi:hypothetical protein
MGFWRFDDEASSMAVFNNPENRIVKPGQYIAALSAAKTFTPLVLMPYLPGPEYSVDILAHKVKSSQLWDVAKKVRFSIW